MTKNSPVSRIFYLKSTRAEKKTLNSYIFITMNILNALGERSIKNCQIYEEIDEAYHTFCPLKVAEQCRLADMVCEH